MTDPNGTTANVHIRLSGRLDDCLKLATNFTEAKAVQGQAEVEGKVVMFLKPSSLADWHRELVEPLEQMSLQIDIFFEAGGRAFLVFRFQCGELQRLLLDEKTMQILSEASIPVEVIFLPQPKKK